jgi:hypothetical protein
MNWNYLKFFYFYSLTIILFPGDRQKQWKSTSSNLKQDRKSNWTKTLWSNVNNLKRNVKLDVQFIKKHLIELILVDNDLIERILVHNDQIIKWFLIKSRSIKWILLMLTFDSIKSISMKWTFDETVFDQLDSFNFCSIIWYGVYFPSIQISFIFVESELSFNVRKKR